MPTKNRILVISSIIVIAIAVILIFSPILRTKPVPMKSGETYRETITLEDKSDISEDKEYRRHTYSLNIIKEDEYTFEIYALSDGDIILFEYYQNEKKQLVHVSAGGMATISYDTNSAGQKIFYIETLAETCPAEYRLKVNKLP